MYLVESSAWGPKLFFSYLAVFKSDVIVWKSSKVPISSMLIYGILFSCVWFQWCPQIRIQKPSGILLAVAYLYGQPLNGLHPPVVSYNKESLNLQENYGAGWGFGCSDSGAGTVGCFGPCFWVLHSLSDFNNFQHKLNNINLHLS